MYVIGYPSCLAGLLVYDDVLAVDLVSLAVRLDCAVKEKILHTFFTADVTHVQTFGPRKDFVIYDL